MNRPDFEEYGIAKDNPTKRNDLILTVKDANRAFDEFMKEQPVVYGCEDMDALSTRFMEWTREYFPGDDTHKAYLVNPRKIEE